MTLYPVVCIMGDEDIDDFEVAKSKSGHLRNRKTFYSVVFLSNDPPEAGFSRSRV